MTNVPGALRLIEPLFSTSVAPTAFAPEGAKEAKFAASTPPSTVTVPPPVALPRNRLVVVNVPPLMLTIPALAAADPTVTLPKVDGPALSVHVPFESVRLLDCRFPDVCARVMPLVISTVVSAATGTADV